MQRDIRRTKRSVCSQFLCHHNAQNVNEKFLQNLKENLWTACKNAMLANFEDMSYELAVAKKSIYFCMIGCILTAHS